MIRFRPSLLLLATLVLLTSGASGLTGSGEAVLRSPSEDALPSALPGASLCAETAATPGASLATAPPGDDFILCTCPFCRENPEVDCQISPDGYSIRCADWYAFHC